MYYIQETLRGIQDLVSIRLSSKNYAVTPRYPYDGVIFAEAYG